MAKQQSVGIIGLGRMGLCLAKGMVDSKKYAPGDIFFTTGHPGTNQEAADELGIQRCSDNEALLGQCAHIVLAVKPQNYATILDPLQGKFGKGSTLISVVASISTTNLEKAAGSDVSVIRAMPNTPAFVGEAITPICAGAQAGEENLKVAENIFSTVGHVVRVDEKHMNAITGLSGCGPAYGYVVLESLTEAGIKVGLPRELATQLSAQALLGAAQMLLKTGKHPAALKDEVTTPAGCTIDGLVALEEGGLRVTLIKAVVNATRRAETLSE